MTTNQTIDGVPRELLLRVCDPYRPKGQDKARAELRALLDAPDSVQSLVGRTGGGMVWNDCGVCHVKGSYHPDVTWCVCGRLFDAPAAQPQGEPVALTIQQRIKWMMCFNADLYEDWLGDNISEDDLPAWLTEEGVPESLPGSQLSKVLSWELQHANSQLAKHNASVALSPTQEDRETLIGYGRSSGLEEASTLCTRLAYAAYYPPGTRFKVFTPKAQKALGDLLIKAANEIASLPGGPYERFKARQAKKAESAKSR
ncbi:hypothetical protein [Pseudomonas fluorescens]